MVNKYAKMFSLKEISRIPLIELVGDRELQRDVHYSIKTPHAEKESRKIILKMLGGRGTNLYDAFKICEDRSNIYFFGLGWEVSEDLSHIKEKDLGIKAGIGYGEPFMFTDQLSRVNKKAGIPEGYNSIKNEWQEFSYQVYLPKIYNKEASRDMAKLLF